MLETYSAFWIQRADMFSVHFWPEDMNMAWGARCCRMGLCFITEGWV